MSFAAPALQLSKSVADAASRHARATSSEHRTVVRARIVVGAAAGVSNEENARRNGVRPDTVRKWRGRVGGATDAAAALADAPRTGRPPRIALEVRASLMKIACARPTPELAKARVRARMDAARAMRRAAAKELKAAKACERLAVRQQARARKKLEHQQLQTARDDGQCARRRIKRATRARDEAEAQLTEAQADAARARMGAPACLSAVWTHKSLQAELFRQTAKAMSLSEIGRTLDCGGLRPHRVKMWLHSPDPQFEAKVRAICELYVNPPHGAVVLSIDEKTGVQARSDRYPIHTSARRDVRREFEYARNGTGTLIAAFNVGTGEVFGRCYRRTAQGVSRFLDEVAEKHPTGDVYVIWDNLNVHKGELIDAFAKRQGGRFHFVYTPLHASWVNQVEIWFSILQRRVLRHGSFASTADVLAAVLDFVRVWNEAERKPFRWKFRGDFAPRARWAA